MPRRSKSSPIVFRYADKDDVQRCAKALVWLLDRKPSQTQGEASGAGQGPAAGCIESDLEDHSAAEEAS